MNNKHKHFSFFNILLIALLTLSLVSLVSSDFQLDTSVFDRFLKNDQVNSDKNTENSEPLVKQLYCHRLDGLYRVQQASVVCSAILGLDLGRFGVDEAFSFKALDILSYRVLAHACRLPIVA